jgi:hypothetical protein
MDILLKILLKLLKLLKKYLTGYLNRRKIYLAHSFRGFSPSRREGMAEQSISYHGS